MPITRQIRTILALLTGGVTAISLAAIPAGIASATTPPPPPNCGSADGSWVATTVNGKTSSVALYNEIGADACYQRSGNKGTVHFSWDAIGHLYDGIFYFQLVNCTTGAVASSMSKTKEYPNGSTTDGGSSAVTFTLQSGVKYKPRVFGNGEYDRASSTSGYLGSVGYFARNGKPAFLGDGYCK